METYEVRKLGEHKTWGAVLVGRNGGKYVLYNGNKYYVDDEDLGNETKKGKYKALDKKQMLTDVLSVLVAIRAESDSAIAKVEKIISAI